MVHVYRDTGVTGATGTDQRHGWHRLDGRLSGGDTLVVVRIDRIGRKWLDTLQCVINLRARGVKIKSLDETEGWTQYLELDPDDPMAFVGHQMVAMAAWVANQEREVGRRRTREGLAAAKARGKVLGRRRSVTRRVIWTQRPQRTGTMVIPGQNFVGVTALTDHHAHRLRAGWETD